MNLISNEAEFWLTHIWESVLGREGIGMHDDFFELGGHSLQAAAMVREVEEMFGKKLPVAILFKEPTIRQLAVYLNSGGSGEPGTVSIHPDGSKSPLFLVFPDSGIGARRFAHKLGPDQPSLVVGYSDKWGPAKQRSLQEMAACLAKDILEMRPDPPHFLLGWCRGGTLAYEVARQMQAAGAPVELVILLDSFNFGSMRKLRYWKQRIRRHGAKLTKLPLSQTPAYLATRLRAMLDLTRRTRNVVLTKSGLRTNSADCGNHSAVNLFGIIPGLEAAVDSYIPGHYSGRIVLLRCNQADPEVNIDPYLGWRECAPQMEVVDLPGDHVSIFHPPYVEVLASTVSELLNRPRK